MKCRKAQEWISLQMDDQLAPERVGDLQDHLEACADCRQYRDDLQLGLRMMHATEPQLPENFDWKLQLRLSQAMREAARDAAYPWAEERASWWRGWLGRAGASAAVGMAAVLLVALVVPGGIGTGPASGGGAVVLDVQAPRLPLDTGAAPTVAGDLTRRPLDSNLPGLGTRQRQVSGGATLGTDPWLDTREQDLMRIRQLEQDLEVMRRRLGAANRANTVLQARLDSLTSSGVDTR
jgi:hypothetical protein